MNRADIVEVAHPIAYRIWVLLGLLIEHAAKIDEFAKVIERDAEELYRLLDEGEIKEEDGPKGELVAPCIEERSERRGEFERKNSAGKKVRR